MGENIKRDSKGTFQKGTKRIEGSGRKKGSVNASTKVLKEVLTEQLSPIISEIGNTIKLIEAPQDKITAIAKLLPFIAPRMQSIDFEDTTKRNVTAEQVLTELNSNLTKTMEKYKEKLLKNKVNFDNDKK